MFILYLKLNFLTYVWEGHTRDVEVGGCSRVPGIELWALGWVAGVFTYGQISLLLSCYA